MSLLFLLGVDGCSGQAICVERRAPTRPLQTGGKDSPGRICGYGRAPEVQPRDAEAELIAPLNSDSLNCHPCEEQARDTGCSQLGAVLRHLHGGKYPERVRQLLAYQTLIVCEARRCGAKGWLAYDSYFRQQVVGDEKADWSKLNQPLYAMTFMAQGERDKGKSCVICLESDHTDEQCALYSPPLKTPGSAKREQAGEPLSLESSRLEGGERGRVAWRVLPGTREKTAFRRASTGTYA